MSDKVPSTPPPQHRCTLETPKTPYLNDASGLFPTPQTGRSHQKRILSTELLNNNHHDLNKQLLGTPETTPRKRICDVKSNTDRIHHILFPTSHSTVGTGRRFSSNSNSNNASELNKKSLLDLRSSFKIQIEEDEENHDDEDDDEEGEDEVEEEHWSFERERELMNYSSGNEEEIEDHDVRASLLRYDSPLGIKSSSLNYNNIILKPPQTPPNQIMDDEYIRNLNIETCHDSDDLEDVQNDLNNKLTPHNFPNPFINSNSSENISLPMNSNPRYKNEIEMVYHATKEKFWIDQDELGLDVQPRNLKNELNFINDEPVSPIQRKTFDMSSILKTPKLQQNLDLISDLNSTTDEDDGHDNAHDNDDEEVGITNTAFPNPFRNKIKSPLDHNHRPKRKLGVLKRVQYVNNTTGDKHELSLSDDDAIKPRKLDFSNL